MKAKIIYNPTSGKELFKYELSNVCERLSDAGYRVEVYPTKKQKDATYAAKRACDERIDLVIAVGGDGTLNEVISGMAESTFRPKLGHIPAGTTNDFAHTIGISRDINKALDIIINGELVKMDIGKLNDDYFVYVSAMGAFTKVTYSTSSELKTLFGQLAYLFNGITEIPKIVNPIHLNVTVDDKKIEGDYVIALIVNAKGVAGLRTITPNAKLNDGKFDLILVPKSRIQVVGVVIKGIIMGVDESVNRHGIIHRAASEIRIESDKPIRWNIDGEKGGKGNATIKCLREHIEIYVPKETKKELF